MASDVSHLNFTEERNGKGFLHQAKFAHHYAKTLGKDGILKNNITIMVQKPDWLNASGL